MNFVTPLHQATKRDYLARMVDNKVHCMLKAKEYRGITGMGIVVTATVGTSICRAAGSRLRRR